MPLDDGTADRSLTPIGDNLYEEETKKKMTVAIPTSKIGRILIRIILVREFAFFTVGPFFAFGSLR
jgi:hypothetical protein